MKKSQDTINVSVIISNYNNGWRLSKCVQSVIHQTMDAIEIIVVDDASTDNSVAILKEFAAEDSRVKIIVKEKNEGTHMTRVTGVAVASGQYVMFLDGDDYYRADACEKAYKAMEGKYDIGIFNVNVVNIGCKDLERIKWYETFYNKLKSGVYKGQEMLELPYMRVMMPSFMWNKIFKASIIKSAFSKINKGYYNLFEDMYELLVILIKAKSLLKFDDKLVYYTFGAGISTYGKSDYSPGDVIKNSAIMQPFCDICDMEKLTNHKRYFKSFLLGIILEYSQNLSMSNVNKYLNEVYSVYGKKYVITYILKEIIIRNAYSRFKILLSRRSSFIATTFNSMALVISEDAADLACKEKVLNFLEPSRKYERYHLDELYQLAIPATTLPDRFEDMDKENELRQKRILTRMLALYDYLERKYINRVYILNNIYDIKYELFLFRLMGIHISIIRDTRDEQFNIKNIHKICSNKIMRHNPIFDVIYTIFNQDGLFVVKYHSHMGKDSTKKTRDSRSNKMKPIRFLSSIIN